MKFSLRHKTTKEIIITVEYKRGENKWLLAIRTAIEAKANLRFADLRSADLSSADLGSANLRFANLRFADLRFADLSSADLSSANLRSADLSFADLRSANLSFADLSFADLGSADLSFADLRSANLSFANLRFADLRFADLDFSSGITFRCSSFGFKADLRLAAQLAYHFCRIDFGECEEAKKAQAGLRDLANKFHRVTECGEIPEVTA